MTAISTSRRNGGRPPLLIRCGAARLVPGGMDSAHAEVEALQSAEGPADVTAVVPAPPPGPTEPLVAAQFRNAKLLVGARIGRRSAR